VTATVDIVEPMGAEVHVHLSTERHNFVTRLDPHEDIKVGQRLALAFNMRECHFFDAQTEQAIV
jgi:multiple sugar transport system ATP-binding protein